VSTLNTSSATVSKAHPHARRSSLVTRGVDRGRRTTVGVVGWSFSNPSFTFCVAIVHPMPSVVGKSRYSWFDGRADGKVARLEHNGTFDPAPLGRTAEA
jgi:hypothetical protein